MYGWPPSEVRRLSYRRACELARLAVQRVERDQKFQAALRGIRLEDGHGHRGRLARSVTDEHVERIKRRPY